MTALMWFRRDLRLADNPALLAATANGPVVPLFVLDDDTPQSDGHDYRVGAAQRWWLHHSLAALDKSLGGKLVLRRGRAAEVVAKLADEVGASSIHATRLYEPWERTSERDLGERLTLHDGECLVPPEHVRTGGGGPYKVYGPFWRKLAAMLPPAEPLPAPKTIEISRRLPKGDSLRAWYLLPSRLDWAAHFADEWSPGEAEAADRLADFAARARNYAAHRDFPSIEGTSRLSPHLHWGEISPRQLWYALHRHGGAKFLKELAWRDFARSAIRAQPGLGWTNGRPVFDRLRWRSGAAADRDFLAWTRGLTGYPIVDAGMRQLWATGWMHNRVRMIAASFLTKHLLIDWRRGERWFWDTLVDADYGNNSLNWQWIAGTGSDSQLFSRIMAPLAQSAKFDAVEYIRQWVPELAWLGDAALHDPPLDVRGDYPAPIIGHLEARTRALAALANLTA